MERTRALKETLERSVLCWLATVSADGTPNVSPKEIFAPHGDAHIVIADIASPVSVRNIRDNPKVCVSFIDIFRQTGFKVTGEARILSPDEPSFAQFGADLLHMAGESFPIRHIIAVRIDRAVPIRAPSYALFPDRTDEERMRLTYRTYGVAPLA